MTTDTDISAAKTSREEDREYARRRAQVMVLTAVLILLLLLLCTVGYVVFSILKPKGSSADKTGTGSDGLTWVRSIYGWGAAEGQDLAFPSDVAIGPDGTIWTNIPSRRIVVGLSPDGQLRRTLGIDRETGDTILQNPNGIAVSEAGEVYVTDQYLSHVFVFDAEGKVTRSWRVNTPRDVEVIGDRVFVSAMGGTGIFSTAGERLTSVGTFGGGVDQFRGPLAVTGDAETGDFYIADTMNMRLKAYDKNGKLKWIVPDFAKNVPLKTGNLTGFMTTDESGTAPFNLPVSVIRDANGRLIVLDSFLFQMSVLDPAKKGKITKRYGEQGTADGKLFYSTDLAYDADRDWIVVADTENNRLQIFRLEGTAPASASSAFARMTTAAKWACGLPLLLLLLLIILLVLRRRRGAASSPTRDTSSESAESAVEVQELL